MKSIESNGSRRGNEADEWQTDISASLRRRLLGGWVGICFSFALAAWLAMPCHADELSKAGRKIFEKNKHAVVTVEIVLKITYSMEGRTPPPNESRREITATVIDPSGLAVTALTAADPSDLLQRAGGGSGYKIDAEVTDMKILLEDGTELPAEIVLRDKDLDLAFIRPKVKPAAPMAAVDLTKSGKADVLDQYISINRLNKAAERTYSTSIERISAVVQKPRTFYIPDSTMTTTALGSPAFTPDGDILGIDVMRYIGGGDEGGNFRSEGMTSIVLPAADILKAAQQVPAAKADAGTETSPAAASTNSAAGPSK